MSLNNAISLFNLIADEDVIYAYHGDFNYNLTNTLLTDLKTELGKSELSRTITKKTYKILVECLENVYKHATRKNSKKDNEGLFVLSRREEGYFVSIGNAVDTEEVAELKKHLDEVNELNKERLRKKYRESLLDAKISDKGGAGLGIIDIALKLGDKLQYTFLKHTPNEHFFCLELLVQ